jgi:ribosome-associated protein
VIQVTETINLPDEELDWSYARSGGPGGQNVNKVSSKAVLRWTAGQTTAPIPLTAWARMKARFPSRFTVDGDVVISSQEYRDQERNREACAEKLAEMIRVSLVEPTPRKKSKPSKAAKRRRVEDKRRQSAKKQGRRASGED